MNPYLEPHGFLGTGASLLADITLLAYLLLIIPAMVIGFGFARRKMFRPHHKATMTTITIINWILIIFLMFTAYRYDVAGNIATQGDNTRYLLPTIHAIFGIPAQLLATFIVIRMFWEDRQVARAKQRGEKDMVKYWFKNAKPIMRLTLTLWLITAALGVFNYLTRYDLIPSFRLSASVAAPAATPELFGVLPPGATQELNAPAQTPETPVETAEVLTPVATEELTAAPPAHTPEAPVVTVEIFVPMVTVEIVTATPSPSNTVRGPIATEELNTNSLPTPHAPAATPEVQSPVATPEVHAPAATPEVQSPVATEEVSSPARPTPHTPVTTPEVRPPVATEELSNPTPHTPAATPEVTIPVATEEINNFAQPTVHAPAATPEVRSPVATEELNTASSTPTATSTQNCVVPPTVPPPVATEDLSEFTNTPTATNTPDCTATPIFTPTSTQNCVLPPTVPPPVATEDLSEFTNTPTATNTPNCITTPSPKRTVLAPVATEEITPTATPFGYVDAGDSASG